MPTWDVAGQFSVSPWPTGETNAAGHLSTAFGSPITPGGRSMRMERGLSAKLGRSPPPNLIEVDASGCPPACVVLTSVVKTSMLGAA